MLDSSFRLPAELTARITSNDKSLALGEAETMLLRAYTPGLQGAAQAVEVPDIEIHHEEAETSSVDISGDRITILDAWRGKIAFDIYHLLYSASRARLLDRGLFSVHAAAVGGDEQILLVGHSGAGKTTTALAAAQHHNLRVASGNKTLVGFDETHTPRIHAGTPTITIRNEEREAYAGIMGHAVPYYDRVAFELNAERGIEPSLQRIRAIVKVQLHDGIRDVREIKPESALHMLYPFFMDTVNADTIVSGTHVFIGVTPKGSRGKLVEELRLALKEMPVYTMVGSLSYVTDALAKLGV